MPIANPTEYFNETHLKEYFDRTLRKKRGGGRDNLSPECFWKRYKQELPQIARNCLSGSYKFSCYQEKLVLKSSKKLPRILSIPTMRDRLVLGVLNEYLSTVFDDCVSHEVPNSLISKVEQYISQSTVPIEFLRTDFHNFYGTLNIKLLMNMVSSRVCDEAIKKLIYAAITTPTVAGHVSRKSFRIPKRGIPQGLPISNILASVYMKSFDREFGCESAELYIRYVDDILFLSPKVPHLQQQMLKEIRYRNLQLRLSSEKCKGGIVGKDYLDFIGYTIGKKIFIREKNVTRFLTRVSGLATRCKAGYENPYLRPRFISKPEEYIGYYIENFNFLISGFKYGHHLYGWLPYFQSITDVSALYGMDRIIKKRLLKGLPEELIGQVNSLVDTYYAIRRKNGGTLIQNYDSLTTTNQKKYLLARRGRIDREKEYSDEQIDQYFNSYMDFIKKKSEQNIGIIS